MFTTKKMDLNYTNKHKTPNPTLLFFVCFSRVTMRLSGGGNSYLGPVGVGVDLC